MSGARSSSTARRVLASLWALAKRVRDAFPLTLFGALVLGAASLALVQYGVRRIDLVLLVVGGIAVAIGALSVLFVALTALVLYFRLRRAGGGDTLRLECGFAARTGFSLPTLWYVPFVKLRWSWAEPFAEVRPVKLKRRYHEEVTPQRRGLYEQIVRRVEISDAFGFARVAFPIREPRGARLAPSVGALKQVTVVRSLSSGEDLPHPGGQPEGDRADLRRYAPGDPVRFVLWKVFARNRQLVVREPERAISPARQTFAYLVAGPDDEAAAGAARVAVETGALGSSWVLGADGSDAAAKTKPEALEILARSAQCSDAQYGAGLGNFLTRNAAGGAGRVVVFVPPRPGPWLARVIAAARARAGNQSSGTLPVEFVVCTDGIARTARTSWLARVALAAPAGEGPGAAGEGGGAPAPTPARDISEVVNTLAAARAHVLIVDRRAGRVYTEGHRRALEAA